MKSIRYFMKQGEKMPDLIIIPVKNRHVRRGANYLEKMIFYREMVGTKLKILISSKKLIEKIGGFDSTLGFGEDKIFQEKAFELLKVDDRTRKRYKI